MNIIGIIPARYNSSRLPGKPLLQLDGKTMLQRVYENAKKAKSLKTLYIATDDIRIYKHSKEINANVVMTSPLHENGTSRCKEAVSLIEGNYDFVINIQGDEPLLEPRVIDSLCYHAIKHNPDIATTISLIKSKEELFSHSEVKVVTDKACYALYFSRSIIPFATSDKISEILDNGGYKKHLGLYIFKKDILSKICNLDSTNLSAIESLEQLAWLENGLKILTSTIDTDSVPIDTMEDVKKVIELLKVKNKN